jgi:hypothetical protein
MGIGSSVPKHADLTQYIKHGGKEIKMEELLNDIFKWMLENSDVLDYYALASPSECKLYTKSTEEGLTKLFKTLQIEPSEESKSGRIYFQKTAELQEIAKGVDTTNEKYKAISKSTQARLCMQLAYFYLRVLQIYSALALSVLDTGIPADYDTMVAMKKAEKEGKDVSKVRRPSDFFTRPLEAAQAGGGPFDLSNRYTPRTIIKNQNYDILNPYLSYSSSQPQFVEITDGTKRSGIYVLTSLIKDLNENKIDAIELLSEQKDRNDKKTKISIILQIERKAEGDSISRFRVGTSFSYKADLFEIQRNDKELEPSELSNLKIGPAVFKFSGTEFKYGNQNMGQWIIGIVKKILGFDVTEERTEQGILRKQERKSVEGLPSDFKEEIFGVKKIAQILKKSKPKAYCVSRALQLLSPEAFYNDLTTPVKTRICNSSFAFPDSSPVLLKPISEVKGLFYLNQLFFDKIVGSSPAISEQLAPQHKAFMNELKALYEQEISTGTGEPDFRSITEKPSAFCETKGATGVFQTKDKETVRNLREYIGRLLRRQMEHTGNVVKILSELFIISDLKPLKLQPSVWKKGMPEIERIATKARELLTKYYSDCETTYQEATLYMAKRADKFELQK